MAVGKAEAQHPDRASTTGFTCVVPCLSGIDETAIRDYLARDQFFWLDLTAPTKEDLDSLRELFGFHPLALEDAVHFGQRPKLDHYQDYVFLVFYGARDVSSTGADLLREVQMFISGKYLVSLHRDALPALDEQRSALDGLVLHSEQFLLYRVFDALTDSFFPVLARIDDEIDELENAVLSGPTDEQERQRDERRGECASPCAGVRMRNHAFVFGPGRLHPEEPRHARRVMTAPAV